MLAHHVAQTAFRLISGLFLLQKNARRLAHQRTFRRELQNLRVMLQNGARARLQRAPGMLQPANQLRRIRREQFRRRARRRSAHVGREVRDREINLVPHRRNHRQLHRRDRARDDFFVEAPQILETAATTAHHHRVRPWQTVFLGAIQHPQRLRDLMLRAAALHTHRIDQHTHPRRATRQNVQHVANRRARWRRHQCHHIRETRNRLLPRRIKQTLGMQLALQRLKTRLQAALPARLHLPHDHLILPTRLIHRKLAQKLHLHAIRETCRHARGRSAKQHAGKLRTRILQREVLMSGGLQTVIADFSLHPNAANAALQHLANLAGELRHGEHLFAGLRHGSK